MAIRSIAVLGGGSAGLMAALTLKRKLPQLDIEVIRSPDIGIIGVGEGTTATFPRHFFEYLKLKPQQFYQSLREFRERNPRASAEPRLVKFRSGRRERFWVGNTVAIGNSAELKTWRNRLGVWATDARRGLSVKECLEAIRRPGMKWA